MLRNGYKTYRPEVWARFRKYYRFDIAICRLNHFQWAAVFFSLPWLLTGLIALMV